MFEKDGIGICRGTGRGTTSGKGTSKVAGGSVESSGEPVYRCDNEGIVFGGIKPVFKALNGKEPGQAEELGFLKKGNSCEAAKTSKHPTLCSQTFAVYLTFLHYYEIDQLAEKTGSERVHYSGFGGIKGFGVH